MSEATPETNRKDTYQRVTDAVIAALEKGDPPWRPPTDSNGEPTRLMLPERQNGQPYSGINRLILALAARENGFTRPTWMTYKQAARLGGAVRKGQHGAYVVHSSQFTKQEESDNGATTERKINYLEPYRVFNVEQIHGLPKRYFQELPEPANPAERAEAFFAATGAEIRHDATSAAYNPGDDTIHMPPRDSFADDQSYFAALARELCTWTGNHDRVDRHYAPNPSDDARLAHEELVAELGAAFLCAELALPATAPIEDATAINRWLAVLKDDKRAIFRAAADAQRVVDYAHGLQPDAEPEMAPDPGPVAETRPETVPASASAPEQPAPANEPVRPAPVQTPGKM